MSRIKGVVLAIVVALTAGLSAGAADWKLGVGMVPSPGGGARIVQVFSGSPAEMAQLEVGMVIITLNGRLISSPTDARNFVMGDSSPTMKVVVMHNGGFQEHEAVFQVITATYAETVRGKKVIKTKKTYGKPKVTIKKVADPRRKK